MTVLSDNTKVNLSLGGMVTIIGALAVGGWNLRGYAEDIQQTKTITTANTEAIKALTELQKVSQWQVGQVIKEAQESEADRKADKERTRKVEDALLILSTKMDE